MIPLRFQDLDPLYGALMLAPVDSLEDGRFDADASEEADVAREHTQPSLVGLLGELWSEDSVLDSPPGGGEVGESASRPPTVVLAKYVDQIVPHRQSRVPGGENHGVSTGQSSRGLCGTCTQEVLPAAGRLSDLTLDLSVVYLETSFREAAGYELSLVLGVACGCSQGAGRSQVGQLGVESFIGLFDFFAFSARQIIPRVGGTRCHCVLRQDAKDLANSRSCRNHAATSFYPALAAFFPSIQNAASKRQRSSTNANIGSAESPNRASRIETKPAPRNASIIAARSHIQRC